MDKAIEMISPIPPGHVELEVTKTSQNDPLLLARSASEEVNPYADFGHGVGDKYLARLKEVDLEQFITAGMRGTVDECLGMHFEDQKRSSGASMCRNIAGMLCCMTGFGGCYLMSKMVLVDEGKIAVTSNDGKPELLGPGRHVLLSPMNEHKSTVNAFDPHIREGCLHVITVKEDELGLAFVQGKPMLLGPGIHIINDPFFEFTKFAAQSDELISHGTFHRVIVQEGTIGMAWEGSTPILLPAGIYQIDSPLFRYVKSCNIDKQEVALEPFFIITVHDGQVAITYDRGILKILSRGEHWLNRQKNQKFLDFLPTTQQVRELKTLDVLTSDGLMVRIRGSITFRIQDPHLAVVNIGSDQQHLGAAVDRQSTLTQNLFATIMRRANDTLASLLSGTEVLSSAGLGMASATMSTKPVEANVNGSTPELEKLLNAEDRAAMAKAKREEERVGSESKELNSIISHRFKASLTATLRAEWGVELREMNVVDIQVMDEKVKGALADGVRTNIQAVTDRRNAEAKADTMRISAKGESDSMKLKTDAHVYEVEQVAQAQKIAGDLLAETPVAVDIRLAECAAKAIENGNNSLIICKDAGTSSLLQLVGASMRSKLQ